MGKINKLYTVVAVLSVLMLAVAAVTLTSRMTNASGPDGNGAQCVDLHEDGETNDDAIDDGGTDATDPGQADGETNDDAGTDATDPGQADGETNDDAGTDATDPGQTDGETNDDGCDEAEAAPGTLDDGADLLPQASITVEQAIVAAQGAASGDVGEVDLEDSNGTLVFNVDIGDTDVKVDAATGQVIGSGKD